MSELNTLAQALNQLDQQEVKRLAAQAVKDGISAAEILSQCQEGMAEIGRRFDQGECFIPELIVAGKILESVMQDLEPLLKQSVQKTN